MTAQPSNPHDASAARHVDIGADRLAKVYAQAIVEAADKKGCRREVIEELGAIVREVLPKVPKAAAVFESPKVSVEQKEALVDRMAAGRLRPTTVHALKVLARHERLGVLGDVLAAAERLADSLEGRKQATFTTATPVDPAEQARLVAEVEKAVGATLSATFTVDPALIGGLVVRIEDTIYDRSVATGLSRLGRQLKQRSIHEIQYGRDRLGTA
ncbi:MAG: ATP synthase F1 subunit delta [Planctomycetaceae bacterium]